MTSLKRNLTPSEQQAQMNPSKHIAISFLLNEEDPSEHSSVQPSSVQPSPQTPSPQKSSSVSRKAELNHCFKVYDLINFLRGMFNEETVRAIVLWSLVDSSVYDLVPVLSKQSEINRFATLFKHSQNMPEEVREIISNNLAMLSRDTNFSHVVTASKPIVIHPSGYPQAKFPEKPRDMFNFDRRERGLFSTDSRIIANEIPYTFHPEPDFGKLILHLGEVFIKLNSNEEAPQTALFELGNGKVFQQVPVFKVSFLPNCYRFGTLNLIFDNYPKPSSRGGKYPLTLRGEQNQFIGELQFIIASQKTIRGRMK